MRVVVVHEEEDLDAVTGLKGKDARARVLKANPHIADDAKRLPVGTIVFIPGEGDDDPTAEVRRNAAKEQAQQILTVTRTAIRGLLAGQAVQFRDAEALLAEPAVIEALKDPEARKAAEEVRASLKDELAESQNAAGAFDAAISEFENILAGKTVAPPSPSGPESPQEPKRRKLFRR